MSVSEYFVGPSGTILPPQRAVARPVLRARLLEEGLRWSGQVNVPGWYAWDVRVVRGPGRKLLPAEVKEADAYTRDKFHGVRVFDQAGDRYRMGDQEYEMLLAVAAMAESGLLDDHRALNVRDLQAFLCRGAGRIKDDGTRGGLNSDTRKRLRRILLQLRSLRVSWRYGVLSAWSAPAPLLQFDEFNVARRTPDGRDRIAILGLTLGPGWHDAVAAAAVPLRADACLRIPTTVGRLAYVILSSHGAQHDGSSSASGPVGGRSLNAWPILERLGYRADEMRFPSQRARRITALVEQIQNQPLSRGRFLAAVVDLRPTMGSCFAGGNDSVAIRVQALGGVARLAEGTIRHDCVLVREARAWFGPEILEPRLRQPLPLNDDDARKIVAAVGQNAFARSQKYYELVKTIFGPGEGVRGFETVVRDFVDDRQDNRSNMRKPAAVFSFRLKSALRARAKVERSALNALLSVGRPPP